MENKFYRIIYTKKHKAPTIVQFNAPEALKRVQDTCTSSMPDGPEIYLVTETLEPIALKELKVKGVCSDCNNEGWLFNSEGIRTGICPCHY